MQGQQQQAYDRGTTIFSPDGRLYQVEYAREAVKRGTTSVGVRTADGVVLAAKKRSRSPMMEPSSVEKLHKIDDHIGIASAGHVADARKLIDFARQQTQVERLRYGEAIGVETLTKKITDHIQQYTQVGGARPFGVAMIVAGIEDGEPRLFETDPSGTPYEWKALSVGENRSEIREYLEAEFDDDLTLEAGIDVAFGALAAGDDDDGFRPADVALSTIPTENPTYTAHDTETVADYLVEFGYLDEQTDAETDEE